MKIDMPEVEVERDKGISDDAATPTTSDSDINRLTKAQLQTEFEKKEQQLRELAHHVFAGLSVQLGGGRTC